MNKTLTSVMLALLGGGTLLPCLSPAPATIPGYMIPGPGGAAIAVTEFFARQEGSEATAALLHDSPGDVEFIYEEGALALAPKDAVATPAFFDIGADGRPFASRLARDFAKGVAAKIATNKGANRVLDHRVDAIRANCHSKSCSQALVEFTRIYTIGGGKQMHVPMRATALLRYDDAKSSFVIYHWHASRAK